MNQRQIPRLKDVAREAKVSMAAASRILRGERKAFGSDTCQRVIETAQRLGWRPNLLVSGLQTGRTKTIGILIPPYDSYWVKVLSGIHNALAESDYLPITVWIGDALAYPNEREESQGVKLINRLLDRRVDGLILWPPNGVAYDEHFRALIKRKVPVAVIDYDYSNRELGDSINTDDQQGVIQAAEHLLSLGHRRFGCVSTLEANWQAWAVRRRRYFEEAVKDRCSQVDYCCVEGNTPTAVASVKKLLSSEDRPSAIFTVTDHEAAAVYLAARQLGLSIPNDLSIVGFADLEYSRMMEPPLTTIRQKPVEIGRQAARVVLDRLNGVSDDEKSVRISIDTELIIRESTAPLGDG
jgi:LacI family transcriptional regulator